MSFSSSMVKAALPALLVSCGTMLGAEPISTLSAPPPVSISILRVMGALAIVLALFFAAAWVFRNWQRLTQIKAGRAPLLRVLESRHLGARQALHVISYEQQRILVASSPAGISLISHLPPGEEVSEPAALPTAPEPLGAAAFMDLFKQALARKKG